jgi:hypothetical protein
MIEKIGLGIYRGASVLAILVVIFGLVVNIFFVGGGLLPDLGALMMGGFVWFVGRVIKFFLADLKFGAKPHARRPNSD